MANKRLDVPTLRRHVEHCRGPIIQCEASSSNVWSLIQSAQKMGVEFRTNIPKKKPIAMGLISFVVIEGVRVRVNDKIPNTQLSFIRQSQTSVPLGRQYGKEMF